MDGKTKICSKCGLEKQLEFYSPTGNKTLYFRKECKSCNAACQAARRRQLGVPVRRLYDLTAVNRICIKCGLLKSIEKFSLTIPYKGVLRRRYACHECCAAYANSLRAKDPEKFRKRVNKYRAKYPERKAIQARKQMYGLSNTRYELLVAAQKGKCAICKRTVKLCVDHIHGSEPIIIRGLLCHVCNSYLGVIKESPKALFNALNYLRKFQ